MLQPGYTLVTPQFTAVGGGDVDVATALKAVGPSTSETVTISVLDEAGTATETYIWNDWMYGYGCWVNSSYIQLETMTMEPGQSLWVQGASADQGIQSAGEVGEADAVVKLQAGYTIAGNPFPMKVDVQDILAEGTDLSEKVTISVLDEAGTATKTFIWNDWMYGYGCWVDSSYGLADDQILPGQGLWIQAASDAQFVRFPAPEL